MNLMIDMWRHHHSIHRVRRCIYLFFFIPCIIPVSIFAQEISPVQLDLIIPISNPEGEREISLEKYPRIHVLITNHSDQAIRLWKDWNSWGYFNLSFSYQANSTIKGITRIRPSSWEGDFPDFWMLEAGNSVIIEIDMTISQWQGFPDLYGEKLPAVLTATYENKYDPLAEQFGIWVGKVQSAPLGVVFK